MSVGLKQRSCQLLAAVSQKRGHYQLFVVKLVILEQLQLLERLFGVSLHLLPLPDVLHNQSNHKKLSSNLLQFGLTVQQSTVD